MRQDSPDKILIPAPVEDDNCNCSECFYMKMNTLKKLYLCLKHELPETKVDELNNYSKLMESSKK